MIYLIPKSVELDELIYDEVELPEHRTIWDVCNSISKIEDGVNVILRISDDELNIITDVERHLNHPFSILRIMGIDYSTMFMLSDFPSITDAQIKSHEDAEESRNKRKDAAERKKDRHDVDPRPPEQIIDDVYGKRDIEVTLTEEIESSKGD